jgi:hypothetical protein
VIEHIDLAVIQDGKLVIYRDGQRVAEFEPRVFPQIILDLATELKRTSR